MSRRVRRAPLLGAGEVGGHARASVLLVGHDLRVEPLAVVGDGELVVVVYRHGEHAGTLRLLSSVEARHVRVLERLLDVRSLLGVEVHEPLHQVDRLVRRPLHRTLQVHFWPLGEGGEHGGCELRLDGCDACGVGRAGHLEHALELVHRAAPRDERLADEHLRDDAAHRPHVHRLGVARRAEQNLRRAVPAGRHVVCQHRCNLVRLLQRR
mmetsp:Transcript_33696/g.80059  ORF Transcript_33696/g.80059 Transcript_33696/m.80059 type:complete len:210 (+) Transcript_33696:98-727(+)